MTRMTFNRGNRVVVEWSVDGKEETSRVRRDSS